MSLASALRALALALRVLVLDLGLGLEGPGLDYKHVNFILWDVSCQRVSSSFNVHAPLTQ